MIKTNSGLAALMRNSKMLLWVRRFCYMKNKDLPDLKVNVERIINKQ